VVDGNLARYWNPHAKHKKPSEQDAFHRMYLGLDMLCGSAVGTGILSRGIGPTAGPQKSVPLARFHATRAFDHLFF
jgi:hypothetical protein